MVPMGSSANLEGRTLAQVLAEKKKTIPAFWGTGVVKLPGLNCRPHRSDGGPGQGSGL